MSRSIFVNLPVSDLDRSVEFFTQLGFSFNAQFTDENATCMVVNEQAYVMLLVTDRFKAFTTKDIGDATSHTEVILAVSADSKQAVEDLVDKALAAGGTRSNDPIDEGNMYGWSFQDPDGHLWEVIWMDPAAIQS